MLTRASTTITILSIIIVGAMLHFRGLATVGEIVTFMAFSTMLIQRLQDAVSFTNRVFTEAPRLQEFFEVMEDAELEAALFAHTDCVTATGNDETLSAIRQRLPAHNVPLGYGNRVSFAFVASGALSGLNSRKVLSRAAADVRQPGINWAVYPRT